MEKTEITNILRLELGTILRRDLTSADAGRTLRQLGVDSLAKLVQLALTLRPRH